jgi:hypothetical protein
MSLWEYKVITSGKGGFATPAMLEKYLNDLGRDEWEIIHFQSPPDNALAFTGLVRRSTQRDWTLQDAAAAAAKAEAEKLRAEFEAKFKAATSSAPAAAAEEKGPSLIADSASPDDGFRKPVDTSRDSDPDAPEEEKDEWDKLAAEDELPSFFDALKPHLRRNQRGPGMSVGVDYLAKKWDLAEDDVKGALVECGLQIPADEDAKPVYVEYDGDLFWVNINRRGEIWINTREKSRPVFRVVQAQRVATEEPAPKPEAETRKPETPAPVAEVASAVPPEIKNPKPKVENSGASLPAGTALLDKIRPLMRRNRRGPGGSGSTSFLARAFKCAESDLIAGFTALGLVVPATAAEKPVNVEIAGDIWWINLDSRGGVWINGREKSESDAKPETAPVSTPAPEERFPFQPAPVVETAAAAPAPAPAPAAEAPGAGPKTETTLAAVRLLLKETKTGSVAGKVDRLCEELGKSPEDFVGALVAAGLKVPEKPREKPVFVEHAGEIFWLNRNAKDELWLNAKVSKFSDHGDEADGQQKRSRPRKKTE